LNFGIKLHDPVYTERVATVAGSYDGQILTNGGAWFEHVFKGAPAGVSRTNAVTLCLHFPPGTSKWNKIKHRMFSHITKNWRGRPLTSYEVIVDLIANTTTDKGLKIKAGLKEFLSVSPRIIFYAQAIGSSVERG
jgi:hypothetical protein